MNPRFFALLISLIAGGFIYVGTDIKVPFSYDPLGPMPFPMTISIMLLLLSLFICFKPSNLIQQTKPNKKIITVICMICLYFVAFNFLGFMLSTTICVYGIAQISGSTKMQGMLTGLITSIIFYSVFHFQLGKALPLGYIFQIFT